LQVFSAEEQPLVTGHNRCRVYSACAPDGRARTIPTTLDIYSRAAGDGGSSAALEASIDAD